MKHFLNTTAHKKRKFEKFSKLNNKALNSIRGGNTTTGSETPPQEEKEEEHKE